MSKLSAIVALVAILAFAGCASSDCECSQSECDCTVASTGVATAATDEVPSRRFRFTVEAKIPAPEGTSVLDVWVPLPMDDPGVQEISNLVTSTNGDTSVGRRTVERVHGNRMYHVRLEDPGAITTVRWSADVKRYEDNGQGRGAPDDVYLQPNKLIPLDGEATAQAQKLGVDDPSRPVAVRAKIIYDDVLDEMAYDKGTPGYGFGDFGRSVSVCKGNCTDFHARFIGVGRAARIPVRFTMGIPMKPTPTGTYDSYHCWAHWFDGGTWKPVDISEADKIVAADPFGAERFFGHLGYDRLALTFGRDVILEPAQHGEPLNYFVFPYAEADGSPVELGKSNWVFTYEDI